MKVKLFKINPKFAENRESRLEQLLIAEFLRSRGYHRSDLPKLPESKRKPLMIEACQYASVRLANIEAKSKFTQTIKYP